MEVRSLEQLEKENQKVDWIWEPLIPRGFVSLLGAKGGTGKSGFALWLSDKLTGEGMRVLYVDAEGMLSHITERARNWKLQHMKDIMFPVEYDSQMMISETVFPGLPTISMLALEQKYDLIIIDSLTTVAAKINLNELKSAASIMGDFRTVAKKANAGLLVLCHTKKPIMESQVLTAHDISGSHGIVDLARSVMMMDCDKGDRSEKIILHEKTNCGPVSAPMHFTLDGSGIHNMWFDTPINQKPLSKGTKVEKHRNLALELAREGRNKREIRKAVKEIGATEMDASRVVAWLKEEHGFSFGETTITVEE